MLSLRRVIESLSSAFVLALELAALHQSTGFFRKHQGAMNVRHAL